jgi:nucleotide-binding universal stress UspA family protein
MSAPFARLLLATEHTEFDFGAEALAMAIAHRCALPLVAVLPIVSNAEFEATAPQLAARSDAEAARRSEALQELALARQVRLEVVVRRGAELHAEIVDEARQRRADLIVIRRRGQRGLLANLLVGEMVGKVVAQAPCSVLIVPRQARMWSQRVMVGVDPQAPADTMLGLAAGLAADCGLPLQVVCVVGSDALVGQAERVLAAVLHKARAICLSVEGEVRVGRVHDELMRGGTASAADLLVLARQRGDSSQRARVGNNTQKVIGLAQCPVLVHVDPSLAMCGAA